MKYESLYNNYWKKIAEWGGQSIPFNIYRPNYSEINSLGSPVTTGINLRLQETITGNHLEPQVLGIAAYLIFGDRSALEVGDYIEPVSDDGINVGITVLNKRNKNDLLGFRTSQTGSIMDADTEIYTNIKYEQLQETEDGKQLVQELTGFNYTTKKVAFFKRSGITQNMQFIEESGSRYIILAVQHTGNITLLSLKAENLA